METEEHPQNEGGCEPNTDGGLFPGTRVSAIMESDCRSRRRRGNAGDLKTPALKTQALSLRNSRIVGWMMHWQGDDFVESRLFPGTNSPQNP